MAKKHLLVAVLVLMLLLAISCTKQEGLSPEEEKVVQAANEVAQKESELIAKAKEINTLKKEKESLLAEHAAFLQAAIDANASRDLCLSSAVACSVNDEEFQEQIDSLQADNDALAEQLNTLSLDYDYLNMSYTLLKNRRLENFSMNLTNYTFYCPTMTYVDCIDPIPAQNKYLCLGTFSAWVDMNCNITLFR